MKIVMASTGTYHLGLGPVATACNSSGRGFYASNEPVTDDQVRSVDADRLCKKCFPDGRPSDEKLKMWREFYENQTIRA